MPIYKMCYGLNLCQCDGTDNQGCAQASAQTRLAVTSCNKKTCCQVRFLNRFFGATSFLCVRGSDCRFADIRLPKEMRVKQIMKNPEHKVKITSGHFAAGHTEIQKLMLRGLSRSLIAPRRFSVLCVTFGLVAALGYSNAYAMLMAYEGFNYPAGESLTNASAIGGDGSFGWAGRWCGANVPMATNVAGSLGYTDPVGNSLLTSGNSVVIGAPGGTTVNAQPSRSFNFGTLVGNMYTGLTNSPGTYWASFVMQWIGPTTAGSTTNQYVRKGNLVFRSGALTNATSTGTELYSVGSPNAANRIGTPYDTWATWTGKDAAAGTQNTGLAASTAPLNRATFVLIRLDLNGGPGYDTVYTWFNWTNLAVEPPISTADTTNNTANEDGLNNIRLDANGGNAVGTNTVLWFDEFRFGTTFADVAPYGVAPPELPVITTHPASVTVTVGDPVTFSVSATGAQPLFYQWYFNTNIPVANATNPILSIPNVQYTDAGLYCVAVSNASGAVTSQLATLTVLAPAAPGIVTQPQDWTNAIGYPAYFSLVATGTPPLCYQWYFNNTPIEGRTNAALSFTIRSVADAGAYLAIVTNRFGSITSRLATLTVVQITTNPLPAFPGADGAAKYATGGRGGIVYHVTTLDRNFNDSRPGTLRYGLTDANFPPGVPRTIVFDVAGVFWLGRYGAESNYDNGWNAGQSRFNLPANTTIAGQTAPGPVIIMGGVTKAGQSNTVIRNVMFAPGYGMQGFHEPPNPPRPGDFPDEYVYDAIDISGQNILIDHCTAVFATDEAVSCNELANNVTVQYCNISQGQNYPQLDAEAGTTNYTGHALAHLLQAGSNAKISIINNFYAHQKGRLPRVGSEVGTGAINDFRNCLFYNWLGTAGSGASGQPSFNNFINNFYLAGPGGDDPAGGTDYTIVNRAGGNGIFNGQSGASTRAYVSGNLKDTNKDGDPNDTSSADGDYANVSLQSAAYDVDIGVTLNAKAAFTNALRYAGARWWVRQYDIALGNTNAITTNDIAAYIDQRLIHEIVTGTGKIRAWADDPFNDDPNEGVEWRLLLGLRADTETGAAPFNRPAGWDTDGDGMPDYWELEHGLDPNAPNNNADFDNDGYTDLEEYLNEIAVWPAPGPVIFTGATNNRYALIYNWAVYGEQVNITGRGWTTTSSPWQPGRFDTATISNAVAVVDAVGQRAGTLVLTSNATLSVTAGWLKVADTAEIGSGCTLAVESAGRLDVGTNLFNNGTMRLNGTAILNLSGSFTNNGVLDVMTWHGTLPAGFVNNGVVLDRNAVRIASARADGTDFVVTIQGYAGHSYQLQYCDQLTGGVWTSLGTPLQGSNSLLTLRHTNGANAQQRFYRIKVD